MCHAGDGDTADRARDTLFRRGTLIRWCPPSLLELCSVPVIVGKGRRKGVLP